MDIVPPDLPTEEQRAGSRARLPAWLWATLSVVLLFSAVTAFQTRRTSSRLAELESKLSAERERSAALRAEQQRSLLLTAIVSAADTRQFAMFPTGPDTPALRVYWNERLGFVISAPGAPPPKPHRTYQFWIIAEDGSAMSLGVFSPDAAGGEVHVFPVTARLSQAKALVVTDELEGGSHQPSPPALWQADLKRPPIIEEPSAEPPGSR